MKTKTITTIILLTFIAVSLTYFAVELFGGGPTTEKETINSSTINPQTDGTEPITIAKTGENAVVVYYFHGNFRCVTCKTIEAYTRAVALKPDYAEAFYNKANAHFIEGEDEQAIAYAELAIELNPSLEKKVKEWIHVSRDRIASIREDKEYQRSKASKKNTP